MASLLALSLITHRVAHGTSGKAMLGQIADGVRFVLGVPALGVVMLLSMTLNLLIVGPTEIGLPYLAYTRLPEGAAAFGLILSAFGGGSLLGMIVASVLPTVPPTRFALVMLGLLSASGLAVAAMAFASSTLVVIALSAFIGAVLGYTNLNFMTWIQRRIPLHLMGRVMSLLMFSSMALVPISIAVAGATAAISLPVTLIVSGLGMTLITLLALLVPSIRRMGLEPVVEAESSDEVAAEEDAPTAAPMAASV
jgi:hypothetical protein